MLTQTSVWLDHFGRSAALLLAQLAPISDASVMVGLHDIVNVQIRINLQFIIPIGVNRVIQIKERRVVL